LGRAIAQAIAAEGARVAICARGRERLEAAAAAIRASSGSGVGVVEAFPCDLSVVGAGGLLVQRVIERLGGLDVLVTNTGGPPAGTFDEITPAKWEEGFDGLFLSAVEAIRAALPGMRERRWGRILLVTSLAAREPIPRLTVSNALRAGLLGLAKSLSREVAAEGITVNALLPGYTRTERLMELGVDEAKLCAQIPAGRIGNPEELGALAAFLASERAAYITGQAIACDGGAMHSI